MLIPFRIRFLLYQLFHALTPQPSIDKQARIQRFISSRIKIEDATLAFSAPPSTSFDDEFIPPRNILDRERDLHFSHDLDYEFDNIWGGSWVFEKPGFFSREIGDLSSSIEIYKIPPGFDRDIFKLENFVEAVQINLACRFLDSKHSSHDAQPLPRSPGEAYALASIGGRRWLYLDLERRWGHRIIYFEEIYIPLKADYYLCFSFMYSVFNHPEAPALFEQSGSRMVRKIMESIVLEQDASIPLLEADGFERAVQDPRIWQARYKEDIPEEFMKSP